MTALTARRLSNARVPVTRFERTLLRATAAVEGVVATRLERRALTATRSAAITQERYAEARRRAESLGATGSIPR